ncbi:MAG TPA: TonB-dependent receptor [Thermoanaerobaculia bacterium]|nr:TonB-dependent receptor [Thermoanaerobaculia bacterium]
MRRRARTLTVWLLAAAALAAGAPVQAGEGPSWVGLSLTEALLRLEAQGLPIVFTSQLVGPELMVATEPAASDPRQLLDELLAPHGLAVEPAVGGTLVVVRRAKAEPAPSILGTVRSQESGEPLAAVTIRLAGRGVEVASDAQGRFELAGLEPGIYRLEAELPQFLILEVPEVTVGPAGPARLALSLQPMPFVHEEIVVRPSQLPLLDAEPAAPLALSRSDIDALPHLAGDLFRALPILPGIAANDATAQFHVRGGRRDEVQILLDGQELYEAYHLPDFDRALSVVEPSGLASASLSTGVFPAVYGDRMSGVLDMTTSLPTGERRSFLSLALVSAAAGSGGSFDGDRGSWLLSARRGSVDLASRLLGDEDPGFWDLFAKLGYRPREGQDWRGHLLHAADSLDFRERVGDESKVFQTDYDNTYAWLTHQAVVRDRFLVATSGSWSALDRERLGAEDEEDQDFQVIDRRASEILGLTHSWSFEARAHHSLRWGLEARRYETEYDYTSELEPDLVLISELTEPRVGLTRFVGEVRGDHLGLHISDRFSPVSRLTLELGLRWDRHTLTAQSLLSPRASLAWRLSDSGVLRASWGHFHQSQRTYELLVEDGETRFFPAERSEHWLVGWEQLLGRRERAPLSVLRVEAYRREVRDPRPRYENLLEGVNLFPEAEPDRVRITPESSRAEGIELVLRGAAGSRTDWWLSYAWAKATDQIRGREVRRQVDQRHTVNLLLNTRLGERWSLSLAWRYHSGWPTTPVSLERREDEEGEVGLVPVLGPLYSERLPSYHRLDLRASRDWQLRASKLVFFVDLQNVYNHRNQAGVDLAVDEDAGVLRAEEETWPGLFPSLGIRWEW